MIVWTWAYNPFVMGGKTRRKTGFNCNIDSFINVNGFNLAEIVSKNGKKIIVEKTTGGIVGNSFDDVVKDIASSDKETIEKQLKMMSFSDGDIITEEKFWDIYK